MFKTNLLFTDDSFSHLIHYISDVYNKTQDDIIKELSRSDVFRIEERVEEKDTYYFLIRESNIIKKSKNLKELQYIALTWEPETIDASNGLISVKYRNIKTYSGYDFDIAKSALQKWIRRGNELKAQVIAADMDLFRYFEGGKSAWTNFYNRIRIIVLEDIGLAFPNLLSVIDKLLDEWKSGKMCLSRIISLITKCPHSRLFSHLRAAITDKPLIGTIRFVYELGMNKELKTDVDGLIWCIENKNINVWPFIESILSKETLKGKIDRNSRPGFLIFDILEKMGLNNENLQVCKKWYKTLKVQESFLTVMYPVYEIILKDRLKSFPIVLDEPTTSYYYKGKTLEFEDYVIDKHTSLGRRCGMTSTDFAIEGSLVSFEYNILQEEKFKDIYKTKRIQLSEIKKESDVFILKARAQLTCSAVRPDTYFAKDKRNRNIVVKGPFLTEKEAYMSFNIKTVLSLFEGVNTFDVNVKMLIPDMFEDTPLGCRNKIREGCPYYFVVMEDLMNRNVYPTKIKNSKVWPDTKVVDYEELFKNKNFGFGVPSEMSEMALFSFIVQIMIRYILKIGDFAPRNFLRIKDRVYNLDIEGVDIGNNIRFSRDEKAIIVNFLKKVKDRLVNILKLWSENVIALQMVKNMFNIDILDRIREIYDNPEIMF